MTTKTITFWLAVNELGGYHVDNDSARDAIDGVGGDAGDAIRVVAINVTVGLPTVETINVAVAVPAQTQAPAEVTVS